MPRHICTRILYNYKFFFYVIDLVCSVRISVVDRYILVRIRIRICETLNFGSGFGPDLQWLTR
jgi:hypothetical protein